MAHFTVGQLVDVRRHGRATVVEVPGEDPAHPHAGRYLVAYNNGSQYWADPKRLRTLVPASRRVVVCLRTKHYAAAVPHNVCSQDVCLEVGCSWGVTTAVLHRRSSFVVGVDISAEAVEGARQKAPHIRFEVADGFDVAALRKLSPTGTFSSIFVDISGKAPLGLIARLLTLYLSEFPQSTIVLKNEALFKHLEHWQGQGQAVHHHTEQLQQTALAEAGQLQQQEQPEPSGAAGQRRQQQQQASQAAEAGMQQHQRRQRRQQQQPGGDVDRNSWQHQRVRAAVLSEEERQLLAELELQCELFRPPWAPGAQ